MNARITGLEEKSSIAEREKYPMKAAKAENKAEKEKTLQTLENLVKELKEESKAAQRKSAPEIAAKAAIKAEKKNMMLASSEAKCEVIKLNLKLEEAQKPLTEKDAFSGNGPSIPDTTFCS